MTLSDILPARLRYGIYVALVVVGVGLGTVQAWCTAAGLDVPTWHAPSLAVLGYLSAAIGLVAAANVAAPRAQVIAVTDEQRDSLHNLYLALDEGDPARDAIGLAISNLAAPDWDDEPGSDAYRGERG